MRPNSHVKPALNGPARLIAPEALAVKPARILPAGIEPMLSIDDLAALLNCSRRLVERMRSAGKVPRPDMHVGKMPRWKTATIRAWVEGGGRP